MRSVSSMTLLLEDSPSRRRCGSGPSPRGVSLVAVKKCNFSELEVECGEDGDDEPRDEYWWDRSSRSRSRRSCSFSHASSAFLRVGLCHSRSRLLWGAHGLALALVEMGDSG